MRMSFKASMPDPRILIIQIVVVAVLASVFRNMLALFLLVLIVDFLLLLQCGWAVFWKNLLSYAAIYTHQIQCWISRYSLPLAVSCPS